jgi:hypothetical protein
MINVIPVLEKYIILYWLNIHLSVTNYALLSKFLSFSV